MMDDEIYDHIIFLADPDLNEPVLVIALEGWIDAGLGASNAIGTMLDTIYTEVLATFDTEYFIDQRARRPIARIVDGITTELTWPEIQLRFGRDGDGADILFLVGPEPDFHWSDFVDVVTDAPAGPALTNLGRIELLERDAAGAHRADVLGHSHGTCAQTDIETAGLHDETFAGVLFQRCPCAIGFLRHPHVRRCEIR